MMDNKNRSENLVKELISIFTKASQKMSDNELERSQILEEMCIRAARCQQYEPNVRALLLRKVVSINEKQNEILGGITPKKVLVKKAG